VIGWIVLGVVLLVVGVAAFVRAGRLAELVLEYRPPRTRADADRAQSVTAGFRVACALVAAGGGLCIVAGLALA
jgi:hypothetical protein